MTLDTARNVGIAVALGLGALAVVAVVMLHSIAQKLAVAAIFGLLALLVWSQRSSLEECADRVRETVAADVATDSTCSFLGRDITVKVGSDT
jgi:hypothetical protein